MLFDDYDLSSGPTSSPLAPLLDLLAVGRDIGLHVVLSRRVGGSARGAYEAVFARVRELGSPGVILSGDPGEGALLGSVKAAPQPPGRGLLVRRGERPLRIQTAFTPRRLPGRIRPIAPWRSSEMNTAAVTIAGPDRRVDLVVSTETPLAELIPTFVELSADVEPTNGSGPVWSVAPPGREALPLERTLAECEISDGTVLTLIQLRSAALAPPQPASAARAAKPHRGTPRERTEAALPEALGGNARLGLAIKAFFGHEERAADRRVGRAAGAEQPRRAHQARAALADGARPRSPGASPTTSAAWTARSPRRG